MTSRRRILSGLLLAALLLPATLHAEDGATAGWHARSMGEALLNMSVFAVAGMALAIIGYKLFDFFTPGHLHKEIVENKNVAAALVGAAVIIGVCIIVAASMIG